MRKIIWAIIAVFILSVCTITILLISVSRSFDPSKLAKTVAPTKILDKNGQTLITLHSSGPEDVPLNSIPLQLQHALVAIEDERFYQNNGIDFKSIFRALFYDVFHRSTAQGASTISEQLAKMVYLHDDKSLRYKILEAIYGMNIDHTFTKNQILGMYLNQVYLGHGATGVGEAAIVYFNKPVSKLDLAQCALLAGLPQAPSYYDPFVHPDAAIKRRNLVLQVMYKQGYITETEYQKTAQEPLRLHAGEIVDQLDPAYRYIRDELYEEADRLGIGASVLANGGVTVYTGIDPKLQLAAYRQYQNANYFPPNMNGEAIQSGAVFLNPNTGEIEALIGSRGAYVERGLDHATQIHRSPGSTIKPLIVYGPAIASGKYHGDSLLADGSGGTIGAANFNGYVVKDWDYPSIEHTVIGNQVTLREALAESLNVPAVWLLNQIGIDTGIQFASKAGLTFTSTDHQHLGVALGDIENGTNPLEMADAYAAFDHSGIRVQAHMIDQIVNADGAILYQANPKQTRVMSPQTASKMTGLLENNVMNGIANRAAVPGVDVAGKTGSTQFDGTTGDRDVWFAGYTPSVVGAIWMGFDASDQNHYIPIWSGGSAKPAELFSAILSDGLSGTSQSFGIPVDQGVVSKPAPKPDSNSVSQQVYQHSTPNQPPKPLPGQVGHQPPPHRETPGLPKTEHPRRG